MTNMNVPLAPVVLTARKVLATCRESTSRRSSSATKPRCDEDRADRPRVALLLAQGQVELLLGDEGALDQQAAEDGVGVDAGGVARLGDPALDEVDVDLALGTLDVESARPPDPAEHLQDLDDAERVKRAVHEWPECILAPDESRPARAHLSGFELLDDRLPRPDRQLPRAAPRRRRPHQPRRRRRQPPPRRPAGRGGHGARSRRRDLDPVRRLSRLLTRPRVPGRLQGRAGRAARPARSPSTRPWSGPHPAAGGGRSGSIYYSAWPSRSRCSSTPSKSGTATGPRPNTSRGGAHRPRPGSAGHRRQRRPPGRPDRPLRDRDRGRRQVDRRRRGGHQGGHGRAWRPEAPQNGGRRVGHLLDLFRR